MAGPSRKRQASAPAEKPPTTTTTTTATKTATTEEGAPTKPQLPSVASDAVVTQTRASGAPNKRKATPTATSPASDDRRRLVEVLVDGIPGGPVAIAGHVRGHLSVTWAGQALAGASPARPARPASDHRYRWLQVRLTGIPGGDVVLAGLVRGSLAFARGRQVPLHVGGGKGGG
ncbi:MAG: hypothetical protein M1826_002609 [Phylliscum demangeonii]|nr:MAG: hypothetical protein M1826_002609 [Phylliscum demangeonii]